MLTDYQKKEITVLRSRIETLIDDNIEKIRSKEEAH